MNSLNHLLARKHLKCTKHCSEDYFRSRNTVSCKFWQTLFNSTRQYSTLCLNILLVGPSRINLSFIWYSMNILLIHKNIKVSMISPFSKIFLGSSFCSGILKSINSQLSRNKKIQPTKGDASEIRAHKICGLNMLLFRFSHIFDRNISQNSKKKIEKYPKEWIKAFSSIHWGYRGINLTFFV